MYIYQEKEERQNKTHESKESQQAGQRKFVHRNKIAALIVVITQVKQFPVKVIRLLSTQYFVKYM